MSDILDLIDRAIADHAVSRDAMRWTPDDGTNPNPVPKAGRGVSEWVEANLDVQLAPWQRAVLDHDGPFEYGRRSGRTQLAEARRLWLNACVEEQP